MSVTIDTAALRTKRSENHWSQADLCDASGLSLRTVQRMEKDGRCSIDSVQALGAAFNVPAEEFLVPPLRTGIKRGLYLGYAGVALGALFATASIFLDLRNSAVTPDSAGISFGIVGAIAGISCALIGFTANKMKSV